MYRCGGCGLAVVVADGDLIRACSCDAPVVAEMSSTLAGAGGVKE